MIAYISLLAAIGGVLVYILATNAKLQEVGRALMWSGIFLTLYSLADLSIKIIPTH